MRCPPQHPPPRAILKTMKATSAIQTNVVHSICDSFQDGLVRPYSPRRLSPQAILLNRSSEMRGVRLHLETEESLNALLINPQQCFRATGLRALANAAKGDRRALTQVLEILTTSNYW